MRQPNPTNPLSRAGSALYTVAIKARREAFDRGLLPITKVDGLKVISVGNLRAGGSGKTPFAMYVASLVQNQGVKTALLFRGYRGSLARVGGLVSKGDGPLTTSGESGDEAFVAAVMKLYELDRPDEDRE